MGGFGAVQGSSNVNQSLICGDCTDPELEADKPEALPPIANPPAIGVNSESLATPEYQHVRAWSADDARTLRGFVSGAAGTGGSVLAGGYCLGSGALAPIAPWCSGAGAFAASVPVNIVMQMAQTGHVDLGELSSVGLSEFAMGVTGTKAAIALKAAKTVWGFKTAGEMTARAVVNGPGGNLIEAGVTIVTTEGSLEKRWDASVRVATNWEAATVRIFVGEGTHFGVSKLTKVPAAVEAEPPPTLKKTTPKVVRFEPADPALRDLLRNETVKAAPPGTPDEDIAYQWAFQGDAAPGKRRFLLPLDDNGRVDEARCLKIFARNPELKVNPKFAHLYGREGGSNPVPAITYMLDHKTAYKAPAHLSTEQLADDWLAQSHLPQKSRRFAVPMNEDGKVDRARCDEVVNLLARRVDPERAVQQPLPKRTATAGADEPAASSKVISLDEERILRKAGRDRDKIHFDGHRVKNSRYDADYDRIDRVNMYDPAELAATYGGAEHWPDEVFVAISVERANPYRESEGLDFELYEIFGKKPSQTSPRGLPVIDMEREYRISDKTNDRLSVLPRENFNSPDWTPAPPIKRPNVMPEEFAGTEGWSDSDFVEHSLQGIIARRAGLPADFKFPMRMDEGGPLAHGGYPSADVKRIKTIWNEVGRQLKLLAK